jgi:hypothetical protein
VMALASLTAAGVFERKMPIPIRELDQTKFGLLEMAYSASRFAGMNVKRDRDLRHCVQSILLKMAAHQRAPC